MDVKMIEKLKTQTWIDVKDLTEVLGVSEGTIWRRMKIGDPSIPPSRKIGYSRRWASRDVIRQCFSSGEQEGEESD